MTRPRRLWAGAALLAALGAGGCSSGDGGQSAGKEGSGPTQTVRVQVRICVWQTLRQTGT